MSGPSFDPTQPSPIPPGMPLMPPASAAPPAQTRPRPTDTPIHIPPGVPQAQFLVMVMTPIGGSGQPANFQELCESLTQGNDANGEPWTRDALGALNEARQHVGPAGMDPAAQKNVQVSTGPLMTSGTSARDRGVGTSTTPTYSRTMIVTFPNGQRLTSVLETDIPVANTVAKQSRVREMYQAGRVREARILQQEMKDDALRAQMQTSIIANQISETVTGFPLHSPADGVDEASRLVLNNTAGQIKLAHGQRLDDHSAIYMAGFRGYEQVSYNVQMTAAKTSDIAKKAIGQAEARTLLTPPPSLQGRGINSMHDLIDRPEGDVPRMKPHEQVVNDPLQLDDLADHLLKLEGELKEYDRQLKLPATDVEDGNRYDQLSRVNKKAKSLQKKIAKANRKGDADTAQKNKDKLARLLGQNHDLIELAKMADDYREQLMIGLAFMQMGNGKNGDPGRECNDMLGLNKPAHGTLKQRAAMSMGRKMLRAKAAFTRDKEERDQLIAQGENKINTLQAHAHSRVVVKQITGTTEKSFEGPIFERRKTTIKGQGGPLRLNKNMAKLSRASENLSAAQAAMKTDEILGDRAIDRLAESDPEKACKSVAKDYKNATKRLKKQREELKTLNKRRNKEMDPAASAELSKQLDLLYAEIGKTMDSIREISEQFRAIKLHFGKQGEKRLEFRTRPNRGDLGFRNALKMGRKWKAEGKAWKELSTARAEAASMVDKTLSTTRKAGQRFTYTLEQRSWIQQQMTEQHLESVMQHPDLADVAEVLQIGDGNDVEMAHARLVVEVYNVVSDAEANTNLNGAEDIEVWQEDLLKRVWAHCAADLGITDANEAAYADLMRSMIQQRAQLGQAVRDRAEKETGASYQNMVMGKTPRFNAQPAAQPPGGAAGPGPAPAPVPPVYNMPFWTPPQPMPMPAAAPQDPQHSVIPPTGWIPPQQTAPGGTIPPDQLPPDMQRAPPAQAMPPPPPLDIPRDDGLPPPTDFPPPPPPVTGGPSDFPDLSDLPLPPPPEH